MDVSNLRLRSEEGSFVIAAEFWDDLLSWAEESGWQPQEPAERYRVGNEDGFSVTDRDAANLAEVLEFIAGDVVLHEMDVSDRFLRELVDALMQLTVLFQKGGFRIDLCGKRDRNCT
jgi:hypothetical protein